MTTHHDEGFTLIEAVIAMLVMSLAVVTLVGALAAMTDLSQDHRGHAVAETAARSFGQAVQALAQSSTPLASATTASASTITVTDATTLPPAGSNSYLLIDREVVRLSNLNRSTGALTVVRAQGSTTGAPHPSGTAVVPFLHCPEAATLTPDPVAYKLSAGMPPPVVSKVEYWRSSDSTFVDRASCLTSFESYCSSSELLPECSSGLFRVSITVTTTGDDRLKGIGAKTTVLVRSGSG